MSTTYDLVCDDCKECIWIGQGYDKIGHYIYDAELESLKDFLYTHKGHKLRYLSEYDMTDELCDLGVSFTRIN